jgi:hypothetical protein
MLFPFFCLHQSISMVKISDGERIAIREASGKGVFMTGERFGFTQGTPVRHSRMRNRATTAPEHFPVCLLA